ncbi:hypothetical protein I4U23_015689 [Adineta vaga]|nr:hypothetical protein I4U23_015689 [Adineta vaga]
MRSGELLLMKFQDKKTSGEKEIVLIDSKGVSGKLEKDITSEQRRSTSTNSTGHSPKIIATGSIFIY